MSYLLSITIAYAQSKVVNGVDVPKPFNTGVLCSSIYNLFAIEMCWATVLK